MSDDKPAGPPSRPRKLRLPPSRRHERKQQRRQTRRKRQRLSVPASPSTWRTIGTSRFSGASARRHANFPSTCTNINVKRRAVSQANCRIHLRIIRRERRCTTILKAPIRRMLLIYNEKRFSRLTSRLTLRRPRFDHGCQTEKREGSTRRSSHGETSAPGARSRGRPQWSTDA